MEELAYPLVVNKGTWGALYYLSAATDPMVLGLVNFCEHISKDKNLCYLLQVDHFSSL